MVRRKNSKYQTNVIQEPRWNYRNVDLKSHRKYCQPGNSLKKAYLSVAFQLSAFLIWCLYFYKFIYLFIYGLAIAKLLVAGFPPRLPGFEPWTRHVGYVVDKVALGQVFSDYFDFPCQFLFHRMLHIHHHLSSGPGTIGQIEADVPSRLSLTPPQETKKTTCLFL
jgi:hypothetical protein